MFSRPVQVVFNIVFHSYCLFVCHHLCHHQHAFGASGGCSKNTRCRIASVSLCFAWFIYFFFWPPLHICCFFLESVTPSGVVHSVLPRVQTWPDTFGLWLLWPRGRQLGSRSPSTKQLVLLGPKNQAVMSRGLRKPFVCRSFCVWRKGRFCFTWAQVC